LPTLSAQHIAAALAQSISPDGGRDGARAVMQALALVGIRPRDNTATNQAPREQTALQALAQAVTSSSSSPSTSSDPRAITVPQAVDQAMTVLVRETLAETMFKPQSLSDYDKVLAVPMHVQHHPTPMRFAIAERETAAGTATFVRVDTELTNLGPLSVRLSGIEGGALSITIFAHGPAHANLQAALPALSDSLRELGVTAGLRVADWNDSHG
jgi:flagellar hook-length control protein FliK